MRSHRLIIVALCALAVLLAAVGADATIPPKKGVNWPQAYSDRLQQDATAFSYSRSYLPLVQQVRANRMAVQQGTMTVAAANASGGLMVSGSRSIPVLTAKYSNTGADPYPHGDLQTELFDGPWPTGTMSQFYQEISYGNFSVTGTVFPWHALTQNDVFYEGGCNGLCAASQVGQFLTDTLAARDGALDFSQFDNDGADGLPNSGDDDGFVDFVAFVHPESGGECGNSNIWSHRWVLSGWTGSSFTTNDARNGGGFIEVDDYVIQPAFACNGTTMIEIGVFAHEFGHAFGLPDLYDTDSSNGDSEGIGNWGLMAGGSWGGDGQSPERPTHMSAWSKEFLGWVSPTLVPTDLDPAAIDNIEQNPVALRMEISPGEYYLVSNRQQVLSDQNLPAGGVLIWRINDSVISANMNTNRVNADENNKGVDLEEADGNADLDNAINRADAGDPFRGSSGNQTFDAGSNPQSAGTNAVCEVGTLADPMSAKLLVSTNQCAGGPSCSSLGPLPVPGGGTGNFLYLLLGILPLALGSLLALRSRRRWRFEARPLPASAPGAR